ncbi:MAG: Rrf2 family transcriptional regulator [Opitutales bacterium]|nr:Rrf2 family transcriptional regulator [Opitutales bacterium]
MKLSLKVEYACQVLAQLGHTHGRKELPHIDDLSRAEEVPSNYLVQILNELRNAGLITSRRGKQGGYALARVPREITLCDVVRALDGGVLEFSAESRGASAERTKAIWREVGAFLEEKLRSYTVEDFMGAGTTEMYYI